MKKLIFLPAILLLWAFTTKAVNVPDAVSKAFTQKFPDAKKVKWEHEKNNDFEAEFEVNGVETSATFSPEGTWKETETEIAVSQLPAAVSEALNKLQPGAKIKEAAKIVKADNSVAYETEIKSGMKAKELLFDSNGNLIK